mgnify:CR=1 FL=1
MRVGRWEFEDEIHQTDHRPREKWAKRSQLLNTGSGIDHVSINIKTLTYLSAGQKLTLLLKADGIAMNIHTGAFMGHRIGGGSGPRLAHWAFDSTPPAFSVTSKSGITIPSKSFTLISEFDTASVDVGGGWSTSKYAVPATGLYSVALSCDVEAEGTAVSR